jgi:hypothetical protein
MNSQRNSTRTNTPTRRRNSRTETSQSQIAELHPPHVEDVLTSVNTAIMSLEGLHASVQKQFTTWSKDPPLTSNRQTRFANDLDAWAAEGQTVLRHFQEAAEVGKKLPPHGRCSPKEKVAKSILAGLRAMRTNEMLAELFGQLQDFANRARQPFSKEDSTKLWDDFKEFIKRLSGALDEMRVIQRLIRETLQRFDERTGSRANAAITYRIMSQRQVNASPIERTGQDAKNGLQKVDAAIDKLRVGVGRILNDWAMVATKKSGRVSLVSQHEEILLSLSQYDRQVKLFVAALKNDEECREVLIGPNKGPMSDLAYAIRSLIEWMVEKNASCVAWLEVIRAREAAAFTLPKEMPEQLADFIRKLAKIRQTLRDQHGNRDDGRRAHPSARDVGSLDADGIRVLQVLLDRLGSHGVQTVKSLAAATHFSEQKVRRILINDLGDEGVRLVRRKKRQRGKGNTSPLDLFYIDPTDVDNARRSVRSH